MVSEYQDTGVVNGIARSLAMHESKAVSGKLFYVAPWVGMSSLADVQIHRIPGDSADFSDDWETWVHELNGGSV